MATYNFPKESIDLIKFTYECINMEIIQKAIKFFIWLLVEKSF